MEGGMGYGQLTLHEDVVDLLRALQPSDGLWRCQACIVQESCPGCLDVWHLHPITVRLQATGPVPLARCYNLRHDIIGWRADLGLEHRAAGIPGSFC